MLVVVVYHVTIVAIGHGLYVECRSKRWCVYLGYNNAYDLRLLDPAPYGVFHSGVKCDGCQRSGIFGFRWTSKQERYYLTFVLLCLF